MIDVTNLSKNYGSTRAVDGISFRVEPGEVVGLLGPNGAGKSTTLKMLTGYLPPTAGLVRLDNIDITEHPLEARRRIGYLSEVNPLYDALAVWETFFLFGRLRGLTDAALRQRIPQVAGECALLDVMSKDVATLSKGYRQRLGLALAILHDPQILILDEPTSALDPNQQKDVRELILRLKKEKTVLLSTHILSEAQRLCDRLLIVHRGKIAAQGTAEELQHRRAGDSFFVQLRAPADAARFALERLPGVTTVSSFDERIPEAGSFVLATNTDPRDAIVRLVVERGWGLLELRRHNASLDDIFAELTEPHA